jgi:hypothetical protein
VIGAVEMKECMEVSGSAVWRKVVLLKVVAGVLDGGDNSVCALVVE